MKTILLILLLSAFSLVSFFFIKVEIFKTASNFLIMTEFGGIGFGRFLDTMVGRQR
jgi:hypothetical protein